jgi:hypothetical protein
MKGKSRRIVLDQDLSAYLDQEETLTLEMATAIELKRRQMLEAQLR